MSFWSDPHDELIPMMMPTPTDDHLGVHLKNLINKHIADLNTTEKQQTRHFKPVAVVFRVYPPSEGSGDREVLYRDSSGATLTAYVNGESVTLAEGW